MYLVGGGGIFGADVCLPSLELKVMGGLAKEFIEPAKHLEDVTELPKEGWSEKKYGRNMKFNSKLIFASIFFFF